MRKKVQLSERENKKIRVTRQAKLLETFRSTVYYKPVVDEYNLKLMHLIDEQYTKTPFYGSRRMKEALKRQGYKVNRKKSTTAHEAYGDRSYLP